MRLGRDHIGRYTLLLLLFFVHQIVAVFWVGSAGLLVTKSILRNHLLRSSMATPVDSMAANGETSSVPGDFGSFRDPLQLYFAMRSCKDQYISTHLNKALDSLSDALRLYGPTRLFSSYNGGKDADVIMHLLRAVYAKYSLDTGVSNLPELVYFVNEDEFDEVTQHIERSKALYNLQITTYDCGIVHVRVEYTDSRCIKESNRFYSSY